MSEPQNSSRSATPDSNLEDEKLDQGPPQILSYELQDRSPATSSGTYLKGFNHDIEPLEDYQDGGFHPVHIGDHFGESDRYHVIHKIGYGGFGTVWLFQDSVDESYVAIKVVASDVGADELQDLALARLDLSAPGAEYVAIPKECFRIPGPNGTHHCIVLPVLGPCVSPNLWMRYGQDPGVVLRGMAYQASQALNFLHKNKICHGDFRPSNILVKLTNLDHLSEQDLIALLGEPVKTNVGTETGGDLPDSSPKYLVRPVDISHLGDEFLTKQICVIDFGESYPFSEPLEDLGIPDHYLPPEILLEEEDAVGAACDLWALGCTLFEIRQQFSLFDTIEDPDELLSQMIRYFGKLPERWWDKWDARRDWFDDQVQYIHGTHREKWSLEALLSKPTKIVRPGKNHKPGAPLSMETPEKEREPMADLLHKLLRYEPSERLGTEDVLEHDWFKV